jgi:hypothetical protein
MALPPFTDSGVLPPGDHVLTLTELAESMLVCGPGDLDRYPNWDADWRRTLVGNLGILVRQLWHGGIHDVFIDGSFVEDKQHPNDIDGYFHCDLTRLASGELERELIASHINNDARPTIGRPGWGVHGWNHATLLC